MVGFADRVQIASTPETIAAGFADRTGLCNGFTTPSITGVDVVGLREDFAYNVEFDDGTTAWFDPSLVVVADVNAGSVIEVAGRRSVKLPSGEWVVAPESD